MKLTRFNFTVLTVCLAIVSGSKAAEAASLTNISEDYGLNNASQVNFGPDGSIYVGETGIGGNGNCQPSPSTVGQPICSGNTGSITRITPDGKQERIFNNFQSLALQPSKNQGAGPQALEFDSKGNAYLLTGYAGFPGNRDKELNTLSRNVDLPPEQYIIAPPVAPDKVINASNLAKLFKADLNTGELTEIFDFGEYEIKNNPDSGDVISNPYALAIKDNTAYVADGGGNAIYTVKLDGSEDVKVTPVPRQKVENLEYPELPAPPPQAVDNPTFGSIGSDPTEGTLPAQAVGQTVSEANEIAPGQEPPPQISLMPKPGEAVDLQSVPTGNTIGPDGALYFGEYTGFAYPEGEARIFRMGDDGQIEVFADGFSHVADVDFDKDGNLLVLQFSDQAEWKGEDIQSLPGSLIQLAPDGTRTTLVAAGEGLESATSITVGPDDGIYITNNGVGPGTGEIVRVDNLEPVPEPSAVIGVVALGALGGASRLRRKMKQVIDEKKTC
jgi:hypothetical protein